jgi:hypothetical protein
MNTTWPIENNLATLDNAIRFLQDARKAEMDKVFGRLPTGRLEQITQQIKTDTQCAIHLLQKISTA